MNLSKLKYNGTEIMNGHANLSKLSEQGQETLR